MEAGHVHATDETRVVADAHDVARSETADEGLGEAEIADRSLVELLNRRVAGHTRLPVVFGVRLDVRVVRSRRPHAEAPRRRAREEGCRSAHSPCRLYS